MSENEDIPASSWRCPHCGTIIHETRDVCLTCSRGIEPPTTSTQTGLDSYTVENG